MECPAQGRCGDSMIRRIDRRAFLRVLSSFAGTFGLAYLPSQGNAQQKAAPRHIGLLLAAWAPDGKEAQAFREGLAEAGYAEGRDVVIEWRWAEGDYKRVPEMAADLVRSKVDVIVTDTTIGTRALQRTTSTIPIVMATVADPLGAGFVASLTHPGGNITGNATMAAEVCAKRLRLLKETFPAVVRVAVLWNRETPYNSKVLEALKVESASLSMELISMGIRTPDEIVPQISVLKEIRADALYVIGDAIFIANRSTIVRSAAKARIPTIYGFRVYVDEGGLISYGPNFRELFRRSAGYVDKILKGANPGDLPIGTPNKFDLAVNLQTAEALGVTIPQSIVTTADEVIR